MELAYLAANLILSFALMGYVIVSNRDRQKAEFEHQERFNAAQERHNAIVQALAERAEDEREADRKLLQEMLSAARKEREVLMDRIQRPDALSQPVPFAEEPSAEPLTVPLDDDLAEWEALGGSAT